MKIYRRVSIERLFESETVICFSLMTLTSLRIGGQGLLGTCRGSLFLGCGYV